jgi:hypothetical protein
MGIDLREIVDGEKTLAGAIVWAPVSAFDDGFEVPLNLNGVTVEGLRLRGKASRLQPDEGYTLQLEFCPAGRRIGALDRIDWRPHHDHNNKGKGPEPYRFTLLNGCHHHQFSLNWYEPEQRMLSGNLPIAVPMEPKLESQAALFAFAENWFRISKMSRCPVPMWQGNLFGTGS